MSRWGDERAVTVQIGAILLLAILVATLSLYQVNAVPQQNSESEFAHHQEVSGELLELRDTVGRADVRQQRGVPITLGTQYQTRIAAINPPAPSGTIRTSDPKLVTIENASVDNETVQDILETPPTTRFIEYEPGYNEYDAPRTVIEHSLLYNEFGDANVTVEEQTMIGENSLTLVFLDGDLSRTSSGRVSVSVETIGGPTAERTLESNGDGNVTITLPTRSPERWEEAVGTAFDEGQTNAKVIEGEIDSQNVTIELADDEYELRMAQVSVGSGAESDERFDDARADDDDGGSATGTGDGLGPLVVEWEDDDVTVAEGETDSFDVLVTDNETGEPVADAWVDFSRQGGDTVRFEGETDVETDEDGIASVEITGQNDGETSVFASSSGSTDRLPITVESFDPPAGEPYFDVSITGTNSPVQAGETLTVETTVENRGETGEQTVVLETDDETERDSQTVDLEADEETTITLAWQTDGDDASDDEYTVVVRSEDTDDTESVRVESGTIDDGSVFGVAQETLSNNQQIDTSFTLDTGDDTYGIRILLVDEPGGGSAGSDGNGWQTKQVFIDGSVLELETAAADDVAMNLVERDLLDADTYAGGDTSILESIRDELDDSSEIRDETHDGDIDLVVTISER